MANKYSKQNLTLKDNQAATNKKLSKKYLCKNYKVIM